MKLKQIYENAVRLGMGNDPRPRGEINNELAKARKEFAKSNGMEKKCFDTARLTNPYADTRILYGDPETEVKSAIVGIDMEGPELLVADRLSDKGEEIDLVIAHHPEGGAWASLPDVMKLQISILRKNGLREDVAKDLMKERIGEVERAISPANHFRSVDIARLLDMPFICLHTVADNHVTTYLQKMFDRDRPKKLSDVVKMLNTIPEYAEGSKRYAGPRILIGEPKNRAGKVLVDMTGGTEGSKKVFARLSQAGVGTIVAMHLSEEHFKIAKGEYINVIIAGHIASDTLGLNLLFDGLEKIEKLKIMECSGFVRIRR